MTSKTHDASIADFVRSIGLLVRRVRSASTNGISISEQMVLGRLEREGPATTADLARGEGVKPQSMGTTVAALEEAGLITRTPHPTDGRQMVVSLTDRGAALRRSIRSAKESWIAQAFARLDKKEQETLLAAGEIIRKMVETKPAENGQVEK